jgi:asparagine synthetase B (glutamine-hydrolysing)
MSESEKIVFQHPIFPVNHIFYNQSTNRITPWEINSDYELDYKSIAVFTALGFMFDNSTYFKQIKVLPPGVEYEIQEGKLIKNKQWWEWYHRPEGRTLSDAVEEFASILKLHIPQNFSDEGVILPISGGLDSRSLLVPAMQNKNLSLLTYSFENGFDETRIGKQISECFSIPIKSYIIPRGYIWNQLEEFIQLNALLTEFTHPRQTAILSKYRNEKNKILLGHWGDVLFDVPITQSRREPHLDEQVSILIKKFSNEGGRELAEDLWNLWCLPDTFQEYIEAVFDKQYRKINIDKPSARMRAFKSLYWAPRFTSVNLKIFQNLGELVLPYYSKEMCTFICHLPEYMLSERKIQIYYIKKYCPELAVIPWQKFYPLNLNNYKKYYHASFLPRRIMNKLKRDYSIKVLNKKPLIERNWENQFLGKSNEEKLRVHLLSNTAFQKLIPLSITNKYVSKFNKNPYKYAYAVSTLLTLSVFSRLYYSK